MDTYSLDLTNLKFEEIIKFISYFSRFHCICDHNCFDFVVTFFISRKRYSIGEVLKRIFFFPGISKVLAVWRDVKPRNLNFAKVDRRGGGTIREGALIQINTVFTCQCPALNS